MTRQSSKKSFKTDPFYVIFKWILVLSIAFTAIALASRPLCRSWSLRYLGLGDEFLLQKRYLQAETEYQKSILLDSKNNTTKQRLALVQAGSRDILALRNFFVEKNLTRETELFDEATAIPTKERDAVLSAKKLIEREEYQLAIIPTKTALEMDDGYRDGWLYLGIANIKCAQFLEIKEFDRFYYLGKAKESLDRAKAIDPEYKPTLDYLELYTQLST